MTLKEILIAGKLTISEGGGGGGGYTLDDLFTGQEPSGAIEWKATGNIPTSGIAGRSAVTSLTIDLTDGYNLSGYAIRDNGGLLTVHLIYPDNSDKTMPAYSITSNANLTTVVVEGGIKTLDQSGLRGNNKLQVVDIENISTTIGNNGFYSTAFDTLIIRNTESIPNLNSIQAFANTKFASNGAGGVLYVPQALISTYQGANNWSTILGYPDNQILPIEGSIYETQYADGTPIS